MTTQHETSPAGLGVAALEGGLVGLTSEHLEGLSSRVEGGLLGPGDEGWDDAVLIWNGLAAKVPAFVVQPTSAEDVAAAVVFAREHGLLLGVKGGGHNVAGTAMAEGGLTLDLSRLRETRVDQEARIAHVGGGCLLQDVDRATQEHGLATVLGFVSEVGVGGLTLGGGLGYLTRRFGWAVDNLVDVKIVTADGEIRTANRDENADLFWAIRGGGGNFGVVTRFTFQLHEVGPLVYGGLIAWPFQRADEVLAAYKELTADAPRELTAFLALLRAPEAPFVPEPARGQRVCAMLVCDSGSPDDREERLAPIRALGDPAVDLLQEWPYVQQQSMLDANEPKGNNHYWKAEYTAELDDELLGLLRDAFAECPASGGRVMLVHLDGALNERDPDDGAVGNRDARFVLGPDTAWEPGDHEAETYREWALDTWERMRPFSTGGTYVNFQTADEGDDRVRASYGANYERLSEIKRRYDPGNLFRVNRNIPPAPVN
jgi:FAD/FMN-containing dehydrogenase